MSWCGCGCDWVSQNDGGERSLSVNATDEIERLFAAEYGRVARLIARVIRDPGRAEELAVDVFLRYPAGRTGAAGTPEGWLSVTAARMALDELRRRQRWERWGPMLRLTRAPSTPEELHCTSAEQARVRDVLSRMPARQAELLLLRNEGMPYEELAVAVGVQAASVGTLLARAQKAFRKEYEERYGTEQF